MLTQYPNPQVSPIRQRRVYNILHTIRSLRVDGVVKVVLRNMAHRDSDNFRHYVCSMLPDGPIDGELAAEFRSVGVEPIFLGLSGASGAPASIVRLIGIMRKLDIDLVHANRTLDLALGGTAARLRGIPVVSTLHWLGGVDDHPEDANGPWLLRHAEMMAPVVLNRSLATRVIAVSDSVKDSFARLPGFPVSRVQVVYPGISMAPVALDSAAQAHLRQELGVAGAGPVLLNVGRLEPVKGQRYLIPMMRRIRERIPGATLLIAGHGELRDSLTRAIEEAGLQDAIHLLGTRADVNALLGISDLLILSSESEAAGLPLLEAMRARRPVVATAVGGVCEIVREGVTGYLVPRADPDALAGGVLRILETPGAAERMGEAGRRIALEKFDVVSSVSALERLYWDLVENGGPGADQARAAQVQQGRPATG